MKKIKYFLLFLVFAMALVGVTANAQEVLPEKDVAPEVISTVVTAEPISTSDVVLEEEASVEAVQDSAVLPADLGVKEVGILPDSPWYAFKRIGRAIRTAVTFNPIKKAEVRLDYLNKELLEAKALLEKKGDNVNDKLGKKLENVIDRVENKMEKIVEKSEQFKERRAEGDATVDKFLDKLADHQIKQQKILENIEARVPEAAFIKIKEARERHLERFSEVMEKASENSQQIADRLDRAFDSQRGSEFREFRNVEFLKRMQDYVPDDLRDKLRKVEDRRFEDFGNRVNDGSSKDWERKFRAYVKNVDGDVERHIEILDDFKDRSDASPDFIKQLNRIKEQSFKRFEDRLGEFDSGEARDVYIAGIKGDDASDLRIRHQLLERLPEQDREEIEKADLESASRFRDKFRDDPEAIRKVDLFEKLNSNPDSVDFAAVERLYESLTPEQQAFVGKMEKEAGEHMQERFERDGMFDPRFADPTDPRSLEVLENLRDRLPENARHGIERAIDAQRNGFREHVRDLNDPEILRRIESFVERDSALRDAFKSGDPRFFEKMDVRRVELEGKAERIRTEFDIMEKMRRLEEEKEHLERQFEGDERMREGEKQRIEEEKRKLERELGHKKKEFENRRETGERTFEERREIEKREDGRLEREREELGEKMDLGDDERERKEFKNRENEPLSERREIREREFDRRSLYLERFPELKTDGVSVTPIPIPQPSVTPIPIPRPSVTPIPIPQPSVTPIPIPQPVKARVETFFNPMTEVKKIELNQQAESFLDGFIGTSVNVVQ